MSELGLGSTSIKQSTKRDGVARAWDDIGGLIGHWDFSDASTMYTTTGGATNVSSDGDNIGRITNKVTTGGQLGTALLGSGYPLYKTGGTNSKTYGLFDDDILRCAYNAGNVDTNVTSTSDWSYTGTTFFFVIDPDAATYTSDKILWKLWGRDYINYPSGVGFEDQSVGFGLEADDDEMRVTTYDGSAPGVSHDTGIDNATGAQLWTFGYKQTGNLATAGILYKDGVSGSSYTVDLSGETFYSTSTVELSNQGGAFSIGHDINTVGLPIGNHWNGKVYEVLIYNIDMSPTDRTLVEAHLKTKYGIS